MRKLLLLLLAALVLWCAVPAAGYATKNVFLCVMDGVRYSDTFGDPSHGNIPHLWNDLRPLAAIYTNFYNTGVTVTRQGHSTLATGTWQTCPNGGPRMTMPSIFDYYRDEIGVPQSKTWALFGKGAYSWAEYSSFPAYRDRFKPSFQIGIGENSAEQDNKVLARLDQVMREDRPSLVFVNFGYTDHSGHKGDFQEYQKAIQNVDTIFWKIWQAIQSNPDYKDKTTLVLVNDHGRHDDAHGGFRAHGDSCEGCQHIMLAILGPDVKKGTEITRRALQIDIAPTIGELLGFQTPLAKGEVLSDCLARFEGLNKKEARTQTARRAVEMQNLAARPLVKVASDRLLSTIKQSDLAPGAPAQLAFAGLLAAGEKTGDPKYARFVDETLNRLAEAGGGEGRNWRVLISSLPRDGKAFAGEIEEAMASVDAGEAGPLTPLICACAARLYQGRAADGLLKYLASRSEGYTPELAYEVVETALQCPDHQGIQKEAMFAVAYALGQIPECGGLGKDAGDSALALYTLSRAKRLPWWKELGRAKNAGGQQMPDLLQSMARPELDRLVAALGQPGSKAPRRAFLDTARLRANVGFPFSRDLLSYSIDAEGDAASRDKLVAAGAFLLLQFEPAPARGRGRSRKPAGRVAPNAPGSML